MNQQQPDQSLEAGIKSGDVSTVRTLLKGNEGLADHRFDGVSAILLSFYHRQPEIARLLAETKKTPLTIFEATALGDYEAQMRLLKANPALVRDFTPDGFTALHLASFLNQPAAARILLARGADVDALTNNGQQIRPIHSAAASRSAAMVRILLAAGANPDAPQNGGFTALHSAAKHGDRAMVTSLLAHGADPAIRSNDKQTAADFAKEAGEQKIADQLDSWLAGKE